MTGKLESLLYEATNHRAEVDELKQIIQDTNKDSNNTDQVDQILQDKDSSNTDQVDQILQDKDSNIY